MDTVHHDSSFDNIISEVWKKPQVLNKVSSFAKHWRKKHEEKVKTRIYHLQNKKQTRDLKLQKHVTELLTRKLPFEYLAQDWLDEQKVTLEARAYLLEKLIPTLIMGVEKLLIEVWKRDMVDDQTLTEDFNPINFLAQFLMRNNPKYSNFAISSPYAKSIRKMLDNLKEKAFDYGDDNKLACMKAEAKKRLDEAEKLKKMNLWIRKSQPEALEEMYVKWTGDRRAVISLSLVQSALRSFQDYLMMLPTERQQGLMYAFKVEETDITGKLINIKDFVEYVGKHISTLSDDGFCEFMQHMSRLADEYRQNIEQEALRNVFGHLFVFCDHGKTGYLDRLRVLELLEMFYDSIQGSFKEYLNNPRKWPVVELEEEEDEIEKYIVDHNLKNLPSQDDTEENNNNVVAREESFDCVKSGGDNSTATRVGGVDGKVKRKNNNPMNDVMKISVVTSPESSCTEVNKMAESDVESYFSDQSYAKTEQKQMKYIDENGKIHFAATGVNIEDDVKDIMESGASSSEPETLFGVSRPFSFTTPQAFNKTSLNEHQFVNLLMRFLGESPRGEAVEPLVKFIRAGYIETELERTKRIDESRKEADSIRRRMQVDRLFELWDIDGSGYLEIEEIEMVLSKWREDDLHEHMLKEACEVFEDVFSKITKKSFKRIVDKICDMFEEEDVFDSLIQFLTRSVQRSYEERKRGDYRKKWLQSIDFSARTSGGILKPVFKTVFGVVDFDAERHGNMKKTCAYVALLEPNDNKNPAVKGEDVLRYIACSASDTDKVLQRVLHRGMKSISFNAIDSGKPIYVPRVLQHGGVHLWNPIRREDKVEGSFISLPLKDRDKNVIGMLGIDTLADPHDRSVFMAHEISFYQGLAKALSQAIQFIDMRQKTLKVSESAVSWILRRSPNVHEVTIYLAEPALKAATGSVLRRMVTLGQGYSQRPTQTPRLERKDNLFRDYLFKCIDASETLTADAYGERHFAFPLRDAEGMVVLIVDISIDKSKTLAAHERKEIQRMLKLLEMAHKEMSSEEAGEDKHIVLEVEKEHENQRIDVLFDRIMLQDLRANVGRLDARAFAEIKSYKDPPKIIHDILKAVLGLYFSAKDDEDIEVKLEEWTTAKQLVSNDLIKWMMSYDPTARSNIGRGEARLTEYLSDVMPYAVAKHGSLPAQYLFNWAFVCLSLIEHTNKMQALRHTKASLTRENEANYANAVNPE